VAQTLQELGRRIQSAQDLLDIVGTMKSLAAVSISHYEQAAASIGQYDHTVALALRALFRARRAALGRRARRAEEEGGAACAVVFGSDQGLCGAFNDHIVTHALGAMERGGAGGLMTLVIGFRAGQLLAQEGVDIDELLAVPASLPGITSIVQHVLTRLDEWQREREMRRVLLFHNRPLAGAAYEPRTMRLLPLDESWYRDLMEKGWPTRQVPAFTMERQALFSALVRQYLFVSLYRAQAESMAAESAGRLSAMQAAERNIEERLEEFQSSFRRMRQSAITSELLDVMSGFEALGGERGET
jgi:F-type H+-transporting ATPase subunit gamma